MSNMPVTGNTPELTRAYLINIAETIQNVLMPQLDDDACGRAFDCLRIVTRLATQLTSANMAAALQQGHTENAITTAPNEGQAFEYFNVEAGKLLAQITAAPAVSVRQFDVAALENFLREHPLGGRQLRIVGSKMLAGGRSKVTVMVSQEGAKNLPGDLIVRQDWSASIVSGSVLTEFELLKRLHDADIKVPQSLVLNAPKESGGNPYIVVTRSKGKTSGDNQQALPVSEKPVLQLAEQIGRVHALNVDEFAGLQGITERNFTTEQLKETLDRYAVTIRQLGNPHSHLADATISWLQKNVARAANGPKSLVHGDLGFHNCLCEGEELSVILDWELAHIGSAAYDLGYLRNAITDDAMWSRFMSAYNASGGPQVEPFLVDYFHLFGCIWFYQLVLQARAGLSAGAVHDITIVAACADILPPMMAEMSRSLNRSIAAYN